jgi:hypothetical protein
MKILNHPEATVDDLISASMYYEANKKKIKAQRLGKDCYKYINQYIDNEIKQTYKKFDIKFYEVR